MNEKEDQKEIKIYAIEIYPLWNGETQIFHTLEEIRKHLQENDYELVEDGAKLNSLRIILHYSNGIESSAIAKSSKEALWYLELHQAGLKVTNQLGH